MRTETPELPRSLEQILLELTGYYELLGLDRPRASPGPPDGTGGIPVPKSVGQSPSSRQPSDMPFPVNLRWAALGCVLVFTFIGCASMDVKDDSIQGAARIERPAAIYIRTFEPGKVWEGDFGGKTQEAFIQQELAVFNQRLETTLQEIAPTSMAPSPQPASGLLVTGQLTRVHAGSGAARYFLGGYGVGAREVVGRVMVYDLAQSTTVPVLAFNIEGGSRGEGGIIGGVENLDSEWTRIGRETRNLLLKRMQP